MRPIARGERQASTPAMNSMKNGSSASVEAGRARISPQASAREAESERAARLGYQPSSSAIARIRSRVSSETPGRPLRAYETAPLETPARSAMSLIVVRRPCAISVLINDPLSASGRPCSIGRSLNRFLRVSLRGRLNRLSVRPVRRRLLMRFRGLECRAGQDGSMPKETPQTRTRRQRSADWSCPGCCSPSPSSPDWQPSSASRAGAVGTTGRLASWGRTPGGAA